MQVSRFFRYLAPNLITLSSMIFGLVSLWSRHNGDTPLAAWMIIYAVLTDRLDGLTARALKATSELGMQLDSFADALNFTVAPAYMVLCYLEARLDLPYHDGGTAHYLLFECWPFKAGNTMLVHRLEDLPNRLSELYFRLARR